MAEKAKENQYWYGTGRRKTSVALVRLYLDKTKDLVNDKKVVLDEIVLAPLELVGKKDAFGYTIKVSGGGKVSQQIAIRHGIARALEQFDAEFRTTLKKAGFLTRDPREKERKKPGLRRARRAPQWAKR